jgi:YfiR/HmsC-like
MGIRKSFHRTSAIGILIILTNGLLISWSAAFTQLTSEPPQKRPASDETEVKAVFLFNFAQFVEWPDSKLPPDSALVIGVLGKDPFGKYLDETVANEMVNGHRLKVERYSNVQHVGNCHILFINPGRSIKIDDVLNRLRGKNILTVSDEAGFSKDGGMIHFITESNRIKLKVNLASVKESEISISSKLLSLAEIVE